MAKKKAPTAAAPGPVAVRVLMNAADDAAVIYANYAEATFGQHDCLISFGAVPAKLSARKTEEAKGGMLTIEPLVQVVIPPTLLPGLIKALTVTKDAYELQVGPIREPKEPA
jgi:hypothetical protein